jgi:hypothetical protein
VTHAFATHEEASIFAAAKRAEGHYAEMLDEAVAYIYGPLAVGGIRVIVSEETLAEGDDPIPPPPWVNPTDGELAMTVRMMAVGFAVIGLGAAVFVYLREMTYLIRLAVDEPAAGAAALVDVIIDPLLVLGMPVVLAPWLVGWVRWWRGELLSGSQRKLRGFLLLIIVPFLLLAIFGRV